MKKKADIWISAALYFGLGIIVVTLILGAGLPLIERLKDKNVVLETKEVMFALDNDIRQVIRQGPGEQRALTVSIKKGDLVIDYNNEKIIWTYTTTALLSEPGQTIKESNLDILSEPTKTKKEYLIILTLDYNPQPKKLADLRNGNKDLTISNPPETPITVSGNNKLIIKNLGASSTDSIISIIKQ